jgi:hypothetical protein
MATDKHYNEEGILPEALEDQRGTDMPATRKMFLVIGIVLVLAMAVLATMALLD